MRIVTALLFIVLPCSYVLVIAQEIQTATPANIVGKVIQYEDRFPVEQATIQLLNATDSSVVMSTASGKEGLFRLNNVRQNNYILKISFISFETSFHTIQAQNFKGKEIVIPDIELKELSIVLSDAVVVGKMPEVIVKEDTLEYNPASYRLQGNAVVEDLLKRLPGVEVDMNGQITVAEKAIRRVMVDGEDFFGNDPTMTTRNLDIDISKKVLDEKKI
jgi:hypothetical protein